MAKQNPFTAVTKYINESRIELKKVTWPTKEQIVAGTVVVFVVVFIVSIYIGIMDYIFSKLLTFITTKI
ncbi:MAG: preprotein translocase subunit SecE [Actinobacteria bacterium]|nr:preprotein translocase subunit SecE [Actinomycetota bacterium]